MTEHEKIHAAVASIRGRTRMVPDVAVVLGSGLSAFGGSIEPECVAPYVEINGLPATSVDGHGGALIMGTVGETRVAILQGRVHLYEGYGAKEVVRGVRVAHALGASALVLTNAAGGVHRGFEPGDIMVIEDHLNLQGVSCLTGANEDDIGPRFPDMTDVYTPALRRHVRVCAERQGVPLREGVYAGLRGPTYETPAEVRMLATLGADAVGMSTVQEATAARHAGMRICGLSLITNMAAGISDLPLSHDDVTTMGARAADALCALLTEFLSTLPTDEADRKSVV